MKKKNMYKESQSVRKERVSFEAGRYHQRIVEPKKKIIPRKSKYKEEIDNAKD